MKKPNEKEISWSEFLDSEKEEIILARIVFSPGFKQVDEFAIIYLSTIKFKAREIIRFDCSKDEKIHVHEFYKKPPEKRYLNREKSFETIEEFFELIKKKWMIYKKKYLER
jgi:hypothetical protein